MNLRMIWVTLKGGTIPTKCFNTPNTKLDLETMNSEYYKRLLTQY